MKTWWRDNHDLIETVIWGLSPLPVYLLWKDSVFIVLLYSAYANMKVAWVAHKQKRERNERASDNA